MSSRTHHPPPPQPNNSRSKGRKINRVRPQLKRNTACLICRKRRIKCDAAKPHCGSCVRSLKFMQRTQAGLHHELQCLYDYDFDEEDDQCSSAQSSGEHADEISPCSLSTKKRKCMPDQNGDIEAGEVYQQQKILEPQNDLRRSPIAITELTQSDTPVPIEHPFDASATRTNIAFGNLSEPQNDPFHIASLSQDVIPGDPFSLDLGSFGVMPPTLSDASPTLESGDFDPLLPDIRFQPARTVTVTNIREEAGQIGDPLMELLWPGWPTSFPTPAIVDHLVEVFFTAVPSISRIIHRETLRTRLALPPTNPDFPHKSLIHAICAVASRNSAAVGTRSVMEGIQKSADDARRANGHGLEDDPRLEVCFSERHAMYAYNALKFNHVSGQGLYDMLHAVLLLGHCGQSDSRWMDCWVLTGVATRLAICLGLLHHGSQASETTPFRRAVLAPPRSDAVREERRATMWYVLCYDVLSSASSGWPGTLPYDEMTTRLPSSRADFDRGGQISENPQSYLSADLYSIHPIHDSFVMMAKGMVLLSRVSKFVRRHRNMSPEDKSTSRSSSDFRQLEDDIATFSMTFPASLGDPVQYMQGRMKSIDADLISAHLVPHMAAIHLHESFADLSDPTCQSSKKLLAEARACLNIVYLIVSCNADMSYMVAPITSCNYLFTASRTLLLFYQRALEIGDQDSAATLHAEIAVFKAVFDNLAQRHSMGVRHLAMINAMMSAIEVEALGQSIPDIVFSPVFRDTNTQHMPLSLLGRSGISSHTAAYASSREIPIIPDTHPDGRLVNYLKNIGRIRESTSLHEVMDESRGFVRSLPSVSGSTNGGDSAVETPVDALGWVDWTNLGQAGGTTAVASPDQAKTGDSLAILEYSNSS